MSGNYAKRGRGSHNPNSRKASRQERKNNNNSDNSSSNGENTVQQKRNRTITENSMEENYVADNQTADVGVDGPSSSPQQNISGENTLTSSPNKSAAPSAPSHVASSGNVDTSMHAPSNKDLQQPPNASPNLDTNGAPDGDLTPDPVPNASLSTFIPLKHAICMSNAKVQQARIVYDHADSIARFTDQWAVYCFSTCLRITPCFYTVDQKAARRQYVATLIQLPPNVKDINLAPLTRNLGAKAVNVPLSLNSYKPKRWAYVTFNSQETMDAAMEQTISFQGHVLYWSSPDNTNKLCHRCGKLGCALNFCPLKQTRGRSRTRDPVAKLKERFNITQPRRSNSKTANAQRLVSFSSSSRSTARPLPRQTPNSALSPDDANNILNLLRELQCEVANFHKRIFALELADQRMSRIESHLGLDPLPLPNEPEPDFMPLLLMFRLLFSLLLNFLCPPKVF
ncbi:hypothetical protein GLOIN_2v1673942 [Rhizophagus irregularis DAOM 181602=DAOM 197198]|nr:hypothetical protein GLOIN_2v1673942 [Rhizophagus irregularis DAOM 181602=DAOM 197198]